MGNKIRERAAQGTGRRIINNPPSWAHFCVFFSAVAMYISSSCPSGSGEVTPEQRSTEAGAKQMFGMADEHNLGLTYAAPRRAGSDLFIPVNNVNTLFWASRFWSGRVWLTTNWCSCRRKYQSWDGKHGWLDRSDSKTTAASVFSHLLTACLLTFEAAADSQSSSWVHPSKFLWGRYPDKPGSKWLHLPLQSLSRGNKILKCYRHWIKQKSALILGMFAKNVIISDKKM